MPGVWTFNDGSRLLEPIAKMIGVEFDMLNLVFCQFLSVPLAIVYRKCLPPEKTSTTIRLAFPLVWGLVFCWFCYGHAIKHPLALVIVSYALMMWAPTKYVHKLVFIYSMTHLIFIHWFRWYLLNSYSIDITGPMMVLTQKVTTMAFSLHDGRVKRADELTEIQKREALSEVPSVLAYSSYLFHFQCVLTGPLCFYTDYRKFIEGTNLPKPENGRQNIGLWNACLPKFAFSLVCMVIVALTHVEYNPEQLAEPRMLRQPLLYWWLMLYVITVLKRCQYYYAWIFADAVSNLSGFGFNGYDKNGTPKWDLISNVYAWKVESALSLKVTLDNWNCTTMYWLRRVAYERVPKNYRTFSTYMLSAAWHGFFIGYYMAFLTAAIFTIAARNVRRSIRHKFQSSKWLARFYDVVTFVVTKICLSYAALPFMTLHLNPGFFIYKRFYFALHFIALFAAIFVPLVFPPPKKPVKKVDDDEDAGKKSD